MVDKYIRIVFPPILDNFFVSDSDATPVTKEAKTNGTAISFSKLIKIVPKGAIQLLVNVDQPKEAVSYTHLTLPTN